MTSVVSRVSESCRPRVGSRGRANRRTAWMLGQNSSAVNLGIDMPAGGGGGLITMCGEQCTVYTIICISSVIIFSSISTLYTSCMLYCVVRCSMSL